jgi:hypothetical protein
LRISRHKLKIAGNETINGVSFINQDTQERTHVDASDLITNNPSELVIVTPALTQGTYKLEITTQFSNDKTHLLKVPCIGVFDRILTVT